MKVSTKKKIALFIRYLTRIRLLHGFLLYVKLHLLKTQKAKPDFLKHPVHLRPGTTDLATFDQVFVSRIYNMDLRVSPKCIIDCGANVGMASVYFANRFPEAIIVAIEPEDSNFQWLKKNCENYKNIYPIQKAVRSSSGKVKVVDSGSGHYGFKVMDIDNSDLNLTDAVVESISLDEVMKSFGWDHIDFLKIDIEGSERELFASNYNGWLSKTNALTVEIHDRFMPGSSTSVMKAVVNYDFSISGSAEGFFFEKNIIH